MKKQIRQVQTVTVIMVVGMMRTIKILSFIFSLLVFTASCENKGITNDKFIAEYKDVSFDGINDISITQRSKGVNEVVYVVSRYGGNRPVYFVTFNLERQSVTNIDNSNLVKSNVQGYLTQDEILEAVQTIGKYEFYLLAKDSSENLYVNPFYANQPPYLLRLKNSTGDSIVRKGYVYELYKDNWYLNKTR